MRKSLIFCVIIACLGLSTLESSVLNFDENLNNLPLSAAVNYSMTDPGYNWYDDTGGQVYIFGDDDTDMVNLPFSFTFYGVAYSRLYFSSNAIVSFTITDPYYWTNYAFPTSSYTAQNMVALFWDDLHGSGSGGIYIKNYTTYVVISYHDYYRRSGPIAGTFQMVFFSDGRIQFNYDYVSYTGGGYTAGLNYGDGILYNAITDLTDSTLSYSVLFTPGIESDTILNHISDFSFEEGDGSHILEWTGTDATLGSTPLYSITVNSEYYIANFDWASDIPIQFDVSGFSAGIYEIEIILYDDWGGSVSDTVEVRILPVGGNVAPQIIMQPQDRSFLVYSSTQILSWQVVDSSITGDEYYQIRRLYSFGGGYIERGPYSWISGQVINFDITWYWTDHFTYQIEFYDGYGLVSTDSVDVQIYPYNNQAPSLNSPDDITFTNGDPDSYSVSWTWTDPDWGNDRTYWVYRNEVLIDRDSWFSGITRNYAVNGLSVGTYVYRIDIMDAYGAFISDEVTVQVLTNQNPVVSSAPLDLQYSIYSPEPSIIRWRVTDATTIGNPSYIIRVEGSQVDSGFWVSGGWIEFEWDTVTPNVYDVIVEIDDGAGGSASDGMVVTVNAAPYVSDPGTIAFYVNQEGDTELAWLLIDATVSGSQNYSIYLNGVLLIEDSWLSNDIVGNITFAGFRVGTYTYELVVDDGLSQRSSSIVYVRVLAPKSTSNTVIDPTSIFILVFAAGAVVVVLFLIKKKKANLRHPQLDASLSTEMEKN